MNLDLYVSTLQVVPMIFVALFLSGRAEPRTTDSGEKRSERHRIFHTCIAVLGLAAFTISVFVVGAGIEPPAWIGSIVVSALACAMAALSAQVFAVLRVPERSA